jgi:1-pyrroline-5-carboxylate dehydrogenase
MSFRVTYATLSADDDELHAAFDRGIEVARGWLGAHHPNRIASRLVDGDARRQTASPADTRVTVGTFAVATDADVDDAVTTAAAAFDDWARRTHWQERAAILDRAADLISERRHELSALVSIEVGKNRLEALGDVEETADLVRYYTHQLREHDGFVAPMGRLNPAEATFDVLRPHGVWAVIAPFNFPAALAGGPVGAALAAGNTVVLKPSEIGFLSSLHVTQAFWDAGVPRAALNVVFGPGETTGDALVRHRAVDGITFTGSHEVGMAIQRTVATSGAYPRPVICEMGGKNPVVVSRHADLDIAAEGTARSAFGFTGQKCSAASRAYVEASVYDEFVARLAARADAVAVGDPLDRKIWMGPVIDGDAVARYAAAVDEARAIGTVLAGGTRLTDGALAHGHFVAPTVASVPATSALWRDELFCPFITVMPVESLDEAVGRANDHALALTAGFFSREQHEIDRFLDTVDAGVVYVNRRAGATTGAWPGVQPFGGWKGSGSTGKAGGGPYYLQQYLREQSRTILES